MLFFHQDKVALKPSYRIFLNIVRLFVLSSRQKYLKSKNFHRLVFKILASNGKKLGIFDLM